MHPARRHMGANRRFRVRERCWVQQLLASGHHYHLVHNLGSKLQRRRVTIGQHTANKEREGDEADQAHDKDHLNIDQTEWRSG